MAYKKPYNPDDQPVVQTGANDPNAAPPPPGGTPKPQPPKPDAPPPEWSAKGGTAEDAKNWDWVWNTSPTYTAGQPPQYSEPSWQWQRIGDTATQGEPSPPKPTTNPNDPRSIIERSLQTAYGRAPSQQD